MSSFDRPDNSRANSEKLAPHYTRKASSINDSNLFAEMLMHYDAILLDMDAAFNEFADVPHGLQRDAAASQAWECACDALYAVVDAHCALEAFKAVRRATQPTKTPQEETQETPPPSALPVLSFRADIGDDMGFQTALSKLCASVARAVRNGRLVVADVRPLDDAINAEWEKCNKAAQVFALRWLQKKQQEQQTPPQPKRGRPPKGKEPQE